ncbi:hypothetical protein AB0G19_02925 [Streptomyces althioticus]|uniref:hypothetical protein n=1 Tax=Streptomyces althioticus group TaxID=2867194 RepID=UPI00177AA4E5|nr:hypothetical protein GCM10010267_53140 [Streptomyces griseorubens]
MSWAWEYAFGAEEAARTAPPAFVAEVEHKAAELVRAAEAQYVHGRAHAELDPRGSDITVRGGMFAYQIVVRSERVCILQITYLGF